MCVFALYQKTEMEMSQLSAAMMSWVRVWLDLRLFTAQFSDKVLPHTEKWKEDKFL